MLVVDITLMEAHDALCRKAHDEAVGRYKLVADLLKKLPESEISAHADRVKYVRKNCYENYSDSLMETGRAQEALFALGDYCRLEPSNADAFVRLGTALRKVGLADAAIDALETALRLNPQHSKAKVTLNAARIDKKMPPPSSSSSSMQCAQSLIAPSLPDVTEFVKKDGTVAGMPSALTPRSMPALIPRKDVIGSFSGTAPIGLAAPVPLQIQIPPRQPFLAGTAPVSQIADQANEQVSSAKLPEMSHTRLLGELTIVTPTPNSAIAAPATAAALPVSEQPVSARVPHHDASSEVPGGRGGQPAVASSATAPASAVSVPVSHAVGSGAAKRLEDTSEPSQPKSAVSHESAARQRRPLSVREGTSLSPKHPQEPAGGQTLPDSIKMTSTTVQREREAAPCAAPPRDSPLAEATTQPRGVSTSSCSSPAAAHDERIFTGSLEIALQQLPMRILLYGMSGLVLLHNVLEGPHKPVRRLLGIPLSVFTSVVALLIALKVLVWMVTPVAPFKLAAPPVLGDGGSRTS